METPTGLTFSSRPLTERTQLLVLTLLVLVSPAFLAFEDGRQADRPAKFNEAEFRKVARKRPHLALLGNSMLNTRVDRALFNELAHPRRVVYLSEGGTRSTVWYFMLKNMVAPLDPAPNTVVLFFRDYDFTSLGTHLEGDRLETARTYMKPEDGEILDFCRRQGGATTDSWIKAVLPEQRAKACRRRVGEWALDIAAAGQGREGDNQLQGHLNALFDFQNLRSNVFDAGAAANDIIPADSKHFTADPAHNLLGRFHALAEEKGIRLIFYRVKRRPADSGLVAQDADLRAYMGEFAAWAQAHGHLLIDETDDPRLTLDLYHDGDHLGRAAMPSFTRLFFDRIQAHLPPGTAAPVP